MTEKNDGKIDDKVDKKVELDVKPGDTIRYVEYCDVKGNQNIFPPIQHMKVKKICNTNDGEWITGDWYDFVKEVSIRRNQIIEILDEAECNKLLIKKLAQRITWLESLCGRKVDLYDKVHPLNLKGKENWCDWTDINNRSIVSFVAMLYNEVAILRKKSHHTHWWK